jgi:hypothetical protein
MANYHNLNQYIYIMPVSLEWNSYNSWTYYMTPVYFIAFYLKKYILHESISLVISNSYNPSGNVGFVLLVTLSLVLCVSFVDHCLSVCPLSFDHCVVCPSMYELVLPVGIFKLFLLYINWNENIYVMPVSLEWNSNNSWTYYMTPVYFISIYPKKYMLHESI